MEPTPCAVVGARFGTQHANAIAQMPQKARLVTVCARTQESARGMAERLRGGARWTTDFEAILHDAAIEAVFLAVPHDLHADFAMRSMQAGKHTFLEKPIARTIEEADAIRSTVASLGHSAPVFAVNHNQRFVSGHWLAHQMVRRGMIGTPFLATAALHMLMSPTGARADSATWGGGALFDSGIHFLDLLRWIVGEVQSVLAVPARVAHTPMSAEDTAAVTVRFHNGALGQFNMTWAAQNRTVFEPLKILGETGTIRVENDRLFLETRTERLAAEELVGREPWIADELARFAGFTGRDSVRLSVENFIDCVREGGRPLVTMDEAIASLRVAVACNRSMARMEWEAV